MTILTVRGCGVRADSLWSSMVENDCDRPCLGRAAGICEGLANRCEIVDLDLDEDTDLLVDDLSCVGRLWSPLETRAGAVDGRRAGEGTECGLELIF
jgi:hypothetical protein